MNRNPFWSHPLSTFLIAWFFPFTIFFASIFFSFKKIASLEKDKKDLENKISKKNEKSVEDPKYFDTLKNQNKVLLSVIDSLKQDKSLYSTTISDLKLKAKKIKISDEIINSQLNKTTTVIHRFAGELKNVEIINCTINDEMYSFASSYCFITIIANLKEKEINAASLQIVYGNRSKPNSFYATQINDVTDKYETTKVFLKDTSSSLDKPLFSKMEIIFDNHVKNWNIIAKYTGLLRRDSDQEVTITGQLVWRKGSDWNTGIPMFLTGEKIVINW